MGMWLGFVLGCAVHMGAIEGAPEWVQPPPPPISTFLVTGATDGVGRYTAELLAKAGHHLIVHGFREKQVKEVVERLKLRGAASVHGYNANLASMKEVRNMGMRIALEHGHIDGLLNNAGTTGNFAALEMGRRVGTVDGYEYSFAVNVLAPFLLTSILLERISSSGRGRILFTADIPNQVPPDLLDDLAQCDEVPSLEARAHVPPCARSARLVL